MKKRSRLVFNSAPDLFKNESYTEIKHKTIRPFGEFSNFVVEILPQELDIILKADNNNAKNLIVALGKNLKLLTDNLEPDIFDKVSETDAIVSRVDAIYAYNGLIQIACMKNIDPHFVHSEIVPSRLHAIVNKSSSKLAVPNVLTYEDIILHNPVQDDPRVFTLGNTGQAERDFCLGHRYIEYLLEKAITAIEQGLGFSKTVENLKKGLDDAQQPLQEINRTMWIFKNQMPMQHFAHFRQFFGKNYVYGTLSPSGRFSGRIPLLTVLMLGDILHDEKPEFYKRLFELRDLYPAYDLARIYRRTRPEFCYDVYPEMNREIDSKRLSWIPENQESPVTVLETVLEYGAPYELKQSFLNCKQLMDTFTDIHITAAHKYSVDTGKTALGRRENEPVEQILRQRYTRGIKGKLTRVSTAKVSSP